MKFIKNIKYLFLNDINYISLCCLINELITFYTLLFGLLYGYNRVGLLNSSYCMKLSDFKIITENF